MSALISGRGSGWLPDLPDIRDYTFDRVEVSDKLRELGETRSIGELLSSAHADGEKAASLPARVDLRKWCSPIEDQSTLGSCTAHAVASLVEYFERRAFGRYIDVSRLFIYKTTRSLMQTSGDTGAYIRSAMGALVLFGAPPEEYWPYRISVFDAEPPAFCYAFARNFRALSYYRLDPAGTTPTEILDRLRSNISAGLPVMFGFTVYDSISQAETTGKIPFPGGRDRVLGGHAVAAIGYDDEMKIRNLNARARESEGAILVRNSWGKSWGERGYGWLPYDYVLEELAEDFWSLIKSDWIDTGAFGA